MNIALNPKQRDLYEEAFEFSKNQFRPVADTLDKEHRFPEELYRSAGEAGYLGTLIPKEKGGRGLSFLETALVYEAFGKNNFALAFGIATHSNIAFEVAGFTEDSEIQSFVPGFLDGSRMLCFALTEPQAGSDPGSSTSVATRVDGGYLINGLKNWVTHGCEASHIDLTVKINDAKAREMYTFLVDVPSKGVEIGKNPTKMAANILSTPEISFSECFVPDSRILTVNGYKDALWAISIARVFVGAMCIGLCEDAIEMTCEYLGLRKQFGQPLIKNQGLQWKLSDLVTKIEAGRWLVYRAASLMDENNFQALELAMAKKFCAELAVETTSICAQLFGSYGYDTNYSIERLVREARMAQLVDGTNEVQQMVIGRSLEKRFIVQ